MTNLAKVAICARGADISKRKLEKFSRTAERRGGMSLTTYLGTQNLFGVGRGQKMDNDKMVRLIDIFRDPIARKMTNCVCLAMLDPLAMVFRGAADRKIVVPAIERTPSVKRPRNGDVVIWWGIKEKDNGNGYHMAVAHNGTYLEQCGIGGEVRRHANTKYIDVERGKLYRHVKRVRRFKLPISGKNTNTIKKIYRMVMVEKRWNIALNILRSFAREVER